jgi:hypothetical protein
MSGMKKLKLFSSVFLFTASMFLGMIAQDAPAGTTQRHRVGAMCNDGTQSSATGSGACSHHGGVSCWLYDDGTCTNP